MQMGFYLDTSRCIGCETCTVACKNWNNVSPGAKAVPGTQGPKYRRVISVESGTYPNVAIIKVSMACMHCGKPACLAVCPTGAISKRAEDGIVVVDKNKCIGCRYCSFACPFGVPQFGEDGTMVKCGFCVDRLAQGKEPVCVANCPAKALKAGTVEELAKLASAKTAQRLAGSTLPSVFFVSK